jgi:glutamate carboxypeptidase
MDGQQLSNQPRIDAAEILEGIREWVEIETPSTDGAAVDKLSHLVERQFADLGAAVTRVPGRDGFGDHLVFETPWGDPGEKGILVVCHMDTVWKHGTLERRPVKRDGDKVYGPGIYDMKGGAYLAYYAYRHLVRQGRRTRLPVRFLFVSDEEVGSNTSRTLIEAEAERAKYALVMEPGRNAKGLQDCVVTARKAVGRFIVTAHGTAAHAGVSHELGRNAMRELAHQILAMEAMTDYARGITVNVGAVRAGTEGFANVVPDEAVAEVDFRCPDAASAEEISARIRALAPVGPDTTLTIEGGINRPAYERDDGVAMLYEQAAAIARDMGFDLPEVSTGGGSDGNFTAAKGVPTLDGLGVCGAGAHAPHEHLTYSSLEPRTQLLLRLMESLA